MPPESSNARWNPAVVSCPKAKSSPMVAMRLYLSVFAAYSPNGWFGCAELPTARTNHGLGDRCVKSSAAAEGEITGTFTCFT